MSGFLVDHVCYATQLEAANARAATESGRTVAAGTTTFIIKVKPSADGSKLRYRQIDLDTRERTEPVTLHFSPPPCQLLNLADATSVAWQIALVWISVWAISHLRGQFR